MRGTKKSIEKLESNRISLGSVVKKLGFENVDHSSDLDYERSVVDKMFEDPPPKVISKHVIVVKNKAAPSQAPPKIFSDLNNFQKPKSLKKKNLNKEFEKTQEKYNDDFEKLRENFEYFLNLGNVPICDAKQEESILPKFKQNSEVPKKNFKISFNDLPVIAEKNETEGTSEFMPSLHKEMSFNPNPIASKEDFFNPTPLGTKPFAQSNLEETLKQLNKESISEIPPQSILPVFKVKPFETQMPVLTQLKNSENPFNPVPHHPENDRPREGTSEKTENIKPNNENHQFFLKTNTENKEIEPKKNPFFVNTQPVTPEGLIAMSNNLGMESTPHKFRIGENSNTVKNGHFNINSSESNPFIVNSMQKSLDNTNILNKNPFSNNNTSSFQTNSHVSNSFFVNKPERNSNDIASNTNNHSFIGGQNQIHNNPSLQSSFHTFPSNFQ